MKDWELTYVLNNFKDKSITELTNSLINMGSKDITKGRVKYECKRMGLKKGRFKFTPEQEKELKKMFPDTLNKDLANYFGCSIHTIENAGFRLRLKKNKIFLQNVFREKMNDPNHPARKYQIKKGNIPINKGKKQAEYMSAEKIERTKATRFKKGNIPTNYRPVGSERVDNDGYIYVKIADPNKWELKHRVTWEKHFGDIPEGSNIQFKDGNRLNCDDINNLYMIDRCNQMLENTIHRYPTEIKQTIRVLNKLNKTIKNHEKD